MLKSIKNLKKNRSITKKRFIEHSQLSFFFYSNQKTFKTILMAKTREEILSLIKKQRPKLTDDEAKKLLETLETYCELVISYTLKNGGDEEDS